MPDTTTQTPPTAHTEPPRLSVSKLMSPLSNLPAVIVHDPEDPNGDQIFASFFDAEPLSPSVIIGTVPYYDRATRPAQPSHAPTRFDAGLICAPDDRTVLHRIRGVAFSPLGLVALLNMVEIWDWYVDEYRLGEGSPLDPKTGRPTETGAA